MLEKLKIQDGFEKYKQTPTFTYDKVPAGLTRDHSTKLGVWGRLVVHQGKVEYHDNASSESRTVQRGEYQNIQPQTVHYIVPSKDAQFHVEFFKDVTNSVTETHEGKQIF